MKVIVIAAPSGSGKTTLARKLLENFPQLEFSISVCTRDKRDNEVNGRDYYFMDVDKFKLLVKEDLFIEWEMVYEGKYYGTLKGELNRIYDMGKFPVLDMDVNGALSIKEKYPDALTIFISPPSVDVLRERLINRGSETECSLLERIKKAQIEMSYSGEFDYIVINDDFSTASKKLNSIVNKYLGFNDL